MFILLSTLIHANCHYQQESSNKFSLVGVLEPRILNISSSWTFYLLGFFLFKFDGATASVDDMVLLLLLVLFGLIDVEEDNS